MQSRLGVDWQDRKERKGYGHGEGTFERMEGGNGHVEEEGKGFA